MRRYRTRGKVGARRVVPCGMRLVLALLASVLLGLSAKPVHAQRGAAKQEYELSLEGAADFRGFGDVADLEAPGAIPAAAWHQAEFAPAAAVSAYLRIPNLRAYYGLRLEGHYASWDDARREGSTYTAAALIGYKAFLFDMEGDCDCPRWVKSNFFKKAFFVEFGAGYGRDGFSTDGEPAVDDARGGGAYLARLGLAVRLKKQLDVYVAGGGHGFIAADRGFGSHQLAVRPALGVTWRPYYNRF